MIRIYSCVITSCVAFGLAISWGCSGADNQQSPNLTQAGAPNITTTTTTATEAGRTDRLGQILAEFNRGNAMMEQYRYSDAARAYEAVLESEPDWIAARYNLGLAYLNMHGTKNAKASIEAARDTFLKVLDEEPGNPYAQFALGMLYHYIGESEKAVGHFAKVYAVDSDDLYVLYKYAEALSVTGQEEQALPLLEKAVEQNPGFISAVYRLAMLYRQQNKLQDAIQLVNRFQQLRSAELAGGSYTVQMSYGMAGKYYRVLGADNLPLPRPETKLAPITFSPDTMEIEPALQTWQSPQGDVRLPGLAVADVDRDGDLDLCLTGLDEQGAAGILLNDGQGSFQLADQVASGAISPCFGDLDNDGDEDLWLGRAGQDLVLLNDGQGGFTDSGYDSLAGEDGLTHAARLLDIDSDGDLDLFALRIVRGAVPVTADAKAAATRVMNNNRDGAFPDVAKTLGLDFAQTTLAGMLYCDLDVDNDQDLILLPTSGTPRIWANDRVGAYRLLDASKTGLDVTGTVSIVAGDPDKDGDPDLVAFTANGLVFFENVGYLRFEKHDDFNRQYGRLAGTGGQFVDLDNDGDLDLLVGDATRQDGSRGPVLLVNAWPEPKFVDNAMLDPGNLLNAISTEGAASCVTADFTGDGRCDVLLAACGQPSLLIKNATPGGNWLQVDLVGSRPEDNKARSNASAIGARVDVRSGAVYQQYTVGGSSGPLAMLPLRVHAGLGAQTAVEWLKIVWPDAVLQAEVELAANQRKRVEELCRKTSSCPYLFAWNGSQFEFVSDFGGVGGLGYLIAPGCYAPPDPTEYVKIPQLAPLDGQFVLQSLTPLEEVTYFDEAKLIAVDHPEGTEVYPREMMAINADAPPFEVFCFREVKTPVAAVDSRGVDVCGELAAIDRRCAGAVEVDPRFTGLAKEHFLELDFGDALADGLGEGRWILVLYGWVEYGYSSTNLASSQAGLRARAPSIEVERDGRWVEVFHEVGYPAGINHVMTLDVTGRLRPGDRRLRISTNMELYWDWIGLARHEAELPIALTEAEPSHADLHFRGYPREYSPDGKHPNLCDYNNLDPTVGWKLMSGDFTRYGDVRDLLLEPDDCFVIMGHGEEITLRFEAEAFGPVPPGCQRTFLLKTDSYCKDMDLATAYPNTVEPLPFHAMSGYPYGESEAYPNTERTRRYRQQYNTRRVLAR